MARPNYRRRKGGSDTWHFCTNCTQWPTSNYDTWTGTGTPSELCDQCLGKERNRECS